MSGATIKVLYFARLAELVGKRTEDWPLAETVTGAQLLAALAARYPQLEPAERLKLAVNQTHVKVGASVRPGDEVAVFEPVTGG
ncbi:molybdopterin converting factor [Bordetella pertussis]|uniref:Molybdopterin synthase sulfur carrier subunit n=1 Tax=Bordetella pertussis (strain ATCC 9797 / DSM 5571 / CCUG 30873 / LMG 14455 / NCTC 10739 / 18323) TaxID=568706 RepID=A0A0T7CQW4_BORP1|nr:MoaD/ThiS family protein [Bordetella pertussis]AZR85487.1 molybdopterin synthase sulfur carrier subunit [Bordetella pertussis]PNO98339.1 molybdopterin synthase sulfur carrier subunit [Bordetella pertussis 18323]UEB58148.1 MoaD/ThiS family protein [Bordetella pertussis]CCJ63944.1 molybdopterin converting factor [Bordetella pertussis 18323]CFP49733.1 molybdopterin converting factor [Bordetella pertussis]